MRPRTNKLLHSSESDFFADIAVNAVTRIKTTDARGEIKYPINAINVLKAQGKSTKESMFIDGYALNCTVASQGTLTEIVPSIRPSI